jgi:hypothetical protein
MSECEKVLEKLETLLSTFQESLSAITAQIQDIQYISNQKDIKLNNRKVHTLTHSFIHSFFWILSLLFVHFGMNFSLSLSFSIIFVHIRPSFRKWKQNSQNLLGDSNSPPLSLSTHLLSFDPFHSNSNSFIYSLFVYIFS